MQKISPLLWFDSQSEEAVNFFTRLFSKTQESQTLLATEKQRQRLPVDKER